MRYNFWITVNNEDGTEVGFRLENKTLDEVWDYMREYIKQGSNETVFYEVSIAKDPSD